MANLVRRVRTPGGSRYFGLPIGAIITADIREAAKARHGGKSAPKGSTSVRVGKQPFNGQKPVNTKKAANALTAEVSKAKEILGTNGKAPGGPKSLVLNGNEHKFPEGTKIARSKAYPNRIAYAQTPDGRIFRMADDHIDEPEKDVKQGIAQAFNGGGNDIIDAPTDIDADAYDPTTDPNEAPYIDVANLDEGETLSNASGMKSFTKTGDDEWSDSKGFKINDQKMQALVDLGSFGVGGNEVNDYVDEPTNLSDLLGPDADLEDFEEYLDGLPNGQKVTLDTGESYTKTESPDGDTWQDDNDPENVVGNDEIASLAPLVTLEPTPDSDLDDVDSTPLEDEDNGNADADGTDAADGGADGSAEAGEPADGEGTGGDDSGADAGTSSADDAAEPVEGKPVPRPERFDALEAEGLNTVELLELDPEKYAQRFHDAISSTKERLGAFAAAVHVYDVDEYKQMRLFLDKDGKAGLALKDGDDMVSGFNAHDPKDPSKKGIMRSMLAQAIQEGGRRGDAFDGYLPALYAKEGLVPAARLKWNDEFAPENWDYDNPDIQTLPNNGRPDVVLMAYDPKAVDSKYGDLKEAGKGGEYFDDWDDAAAAQMKQAAPFKEYEDALAEADAAYQATIMPEVQAKKNPTSPEYKAAKKAKSDAEADYDMAWKGLNAAQKSAESGDDEPLLDWKHKKAQSDLKKAKEGGDENAIEAAQEAVDKAFEDLQAYRAQKKADAEAKENEGKTPVEIAEAKYQKAKAAWEKAQAYKFGNAVGAKADLEAAKADLDKALAEAGKAPTPSQDAPKPQTAKKSMPKSKTATAVADKPQEADVEEVESEDFKPDTEGKIDYDTTLQESPTVDQDLAEQNVSLKGGSKDLKEKNVSDAPEPLKNDEAAAIESMEIVDEDVDTAIEETIPEELPEVTEPKKVQALRDTFEEPWMAKESLVYGKGDVTPETITNAPAGYVILVDDAKWVKLPNNDWFDGDNSMNEEDILDAVNDPSIVTANPHEVSPWKGIANDVPPKKTKAKSNKTYADKMVEQNKGKTFKVGDDDKYGDQKFVAETDDDGNLVLSVDDVPLTKDQIAQAYKALNTHTSTHVTYGLYTLPEGHPLAEKGLINQFRDTAMLRYPNSKPKAAALLTLKEAGNIQDAPIIHPKGKKILVGDFLNKSVNVQGPAYGFFSIDDLHDAVAVLEHLNSPDIKGKMFKGALTFNLNAVGNIDPSKIIHNGKDKDENRQKFIAYLKNVLDTSALVPTTEQYVARLDAMQPGHKVATRQGTVYTKTPEGVWKTPGEDGALSSGSLYAKHKQALTFFSQTPGNPQDFGDNARAITLNNDGTATLWKKNLSGDWTRVFDDSEKGEKQTLTDTQLDAKDPHRVFTFSTDNEDIVAYDPITGEAIYYDAEAEDAALAEFLEEVEKVLDGDPEANEDIVISEKNVTVEDPSYLATVSPGSSAVATPAASTGPAVTFAEKPKVYVKDGAGMWVEDSRGPNHDAFLNSPQGTSMVMMGLDGHISAVVHNNGDDADLTLVDGFGKTDMTKEFFSGWKYKRAAFLGSAMSLEDLNDAPVGARIVVDASAGTSTPALDMYSVLIKQDDGSWYSGTTGGLFDSGTVDSAGTARSLLNSLPPVVKDAPEIQVNDISDLPKGKPSVFFSPGMSGNAYMVLNVQDGYHHARTFGDSGQQYWMLSDAAANSHLAEAKENATSAFALEEMDGPQSLDFIKNSKAGDSVFVRSPEGMYLYRKDVAGKWTSEQNYGYMDDEDMEFLSKKSHVIFASAHSVISTEKQDTISPALTSDQMIDEHDSVVLESEPMSMKEQGGATVAQASNEAYLQEETDKADAIVPGKYTTQNGGAAYMVVFADGTGIYVAKSGTKKKLTANAVKKNFDSGMTKFHGSASDADLNPIEATPAEKKEYAGSLKKSVKDFTLDDGTYYVGDPSKSTSTIIVVKDGEAKAYKPVVQYKKPVGTNWSGSTIYQTYKVGESLSVPQAGTLPKGSEMSVSLLNSYREQLKDQWKGMTHWVSDGAGGVSVYEDEKLLGTLAVTDIASASALKQTFVDPEKAKGYFNMYLVLRQVGEGKEEKATKPSKAWLQKQFLAGAMADKYGNAILPEGHIGSVQFFGGMVEFPTLLDLKKSMEAEDFDFDAAYISETLGHIPWNKKAVIPGMSAQGLDAYVKDMLGIDTSKLTNSTDHMNARKKAFKQHLDALTEGASIEIPKADTAAYFNYDSFGHPTKPIPSDPSAYGESLGYYSSTGEYSQYIKQIGEQFGGGGIIGQHYAQMTKDEKTSWVSALDEGDFAKMYTLEMGAAAKKGKPHASGYLHPGYPANVETHKVKWGAAVPGEVLSSETIEGNWSSQTSYATMEEINNYLILAKMQNPTFLSDSEKRSWVNGHRQGAQKHVDALSVTALQRKNSGQTPLSEPLVWTDDVVPGKIYTSYFDDTPHPTTWMSSAATEYIADNPELHEALLKFNNDQGEYYKTDSVDGIAGYTKAAFLTRHFQALADEAYAQSLIPVYTRKEKQNLPWSANATAEYTDQFGNEYIFKPRNPNSGKPKGYEEYRAEVEHAGNMLGRAFGLQTPESTLETLDTPEYGMAYGQMQKRLTNIVGEMKYNEDGGPFDFTSLTKQMMVDLAVEHMFDYMLSQDDTHGGNALITDKGRVIGIDKGRAFRDPGRWNGLTTDPYELNTNANTVYASMYTAIKSGAYTKEEIDAAYWAARRRVSRMMKVDDAKLSAIIEDGVKNLPDSYWDMSYATVNGEPVSNDVEGLKAFFFDRKNNLVDRFDQLWTELYTKSGYDGLPEKPENDIPEGIPVGLTNPDHLDRMFENKAKGAPTMVATSQVVGGQVVSWTEITADGKPQVASQFYLSPGKQKEVLGLLEAQAQPEVKQHDGVFDSDYYWNYLLSAAKTVNSHAADGKYNESRIQALESVHTMIQKDLAGRADIKAAPPVVIGGLPYKDMPSGYRVPENHVAQYFVMLEKYDADIQKILAAKNKGEKVGVIEQYQALTIVPSDVYTHSDGRQMTVVEGEESFLMWKADGSVAVLGKDDPDVIDALAKTNGWSGKSEDTGPKATYKVIKRSDTHETISELSADSVKTLTTASANNWHGGSPGSEYEITLATGERIFFRNGGQTGSIRSQEGQVVIKAPNVDTPEGAATAFQRATDALKDFRVSLDVDATEASLENTYWAEMFDFLQNRHPKEGTNWAKAQKKFREMAQAEGVKPDNYLDYLHGSMDVESRNEFWRSFYVEFFEEEIEELIENRWYLPRFAKMDPANPSAIAGRATWLRFDWRKEYEEILASGKNITKTGRILSTKDGIDSLFAAGGWVSAEEIFRMTGKFGKNAASPTSDQANGATHFVWARAKKGLSGIGDSLTSWRVMLHPSTALRSRNYALKSDKYGDEGLKKSYSDSSLAANIKSHGGNDNEVLISQQASFLTDVELAVVPSAAMRDYIIQEFKKRGITEIRGIPVEDRFVLEGDVKAAYTKIRETWGVWTPDED